MEDTFLIHVQIGGLRMPLRIPRKDEEIYRKAEKMLVKHLDEYQTIHAPKLQVEHKQRYEGRFAAFRSTLNVIQHFTHVR